MKRLTILITIWFLLTGFLIYDNFKLNQFKEDNLEWRAFLVYSFTRMGCHSGILFMLQRGSENPQDSIDFCRELGYKTKDIYKNTWKQKE